MLSNAATWAQIPPDGSQCGATTAAGGVEDDMLAGPMRILVMVAMTVLLTTACDGADDLPTNVPTPNVTPQASPESAADGGASSPAAVGVSMTDPGLSASTVLEVTP